ncbi:MAG: VOC family protein [Opitutaceae bacterium]|nr:VOC family protein [Opitutaceae bacterium]
MQKITPFLWFDDQAEEAARFYTSIFPRSKIVRLTHYDEAGAAATGRPKGTVMTVDFELAGQRFVALNGGPVFKFTEAVSFVVHCETQAEIDRFWEKLSAGGEKSRCGWLKDKYGVSWQVVPSILSELLQDRDAAKSQRVMAALLEMTKLEIRALKQAYEQGEDLSPQSKPAKPRSRGGHVTTG